MKQSAVFVGVAALTMTLAVNAAEWFNADIGNYTAWPVTTALTGGTWDAATTGGAMLTGKAPAAKLDIDAEDPVFFEATNAQTFGAETIREVLISSSIKFTAFKADAVPVADQTARAGLIVVDDGGTLSYQGLSHDGEKNVWVALDGATPDTTAEVAVEVEIVGGTVVNYKVGGVTLTSGGSADVPVNAPTVSKVSYTGCGIVSALDADYSAANYAFNIGTSLPEGIAAVEVKVNDEVVDPAAGTYNYTLPAGSKVDITYTPVEGWVVSPLTKSIESLDDNIAVEFDKKVDSLVKIVNGAYYETLQAAVDAAGENAEIVIRKSFTTSDILVVDGKKNLTIDFNGKIVENTNSSYTFQIFDSKVTLKDSVGNGGWLKTADATSFLIGDAAGNRGAKGGAGTSGELVLDSGKLLRMSKTTGGSSVKIEVGTFTINGGEITPTYTGGSDKLWAIDCCKDGKVVYNGGAINAGISLDEGCTFTISEGKTLELADRLACDATGSNFINYGTLKLLPGAQVTRNGDTWFGENGEFANVTVGSVTQTRISQSRDCYTFAADAKAEIFGTEFPANDDKYVLETGAEVTVRAIPEAVVLAKLTAADPTKEITGSEGVYTVAASSGKVAPGDEIECDTPEQAEEKAAMINDDLTSYIIAPAGLSDYDKEAYQYMFEATVSGKKVKIDLSADAVESLKALADEDVMQNEDIVSDILDPDVTEINIGCVVAGFYYRLVGGTDVTAMTAKGEPVQAMTSEDEVTIVKPTLDATAGKAFYKIEISYDDK